ncbi:MAG: AtpZ/AtpI family protein [Candidatus Aminicenantes bacterium]|nr:AtpZ/AtpI family protein [Candidatus Aminicenantes bacterium]
MVEKDDSGKRQRKTFSEEVGKKEIRRIRARKDEGKDVWFGLGMFGLVGWAVSLPTLIGLALGFWIDAKWPSPISWTLIGLFIGVVLGCLNAWYWISKERGQIGDDNNDD